MKKLKHIDDIVRDAMDNYTAVPNGPVWDKIEERLKDAKPIGRVNLRLKYPFFAVGIMAVATFCFLLYRHWSAMPNAKPGNNIAMRSMSSHNTANYYVTTQKPDQQLEGRCTDTRSDKISRGVNQITGAETEYRRKQLVRKSINSTHSGISGQFRQKKLNQNDREIGGKGVADDRYSPHIGYTFVTNGKLGIHVTPSHAVNNEDIDDNFFDRHIATDAIADTFVTKVQDTAIPSIKSLQQLQSKAISSLNPQPIKQAQRKRCESGMKLGSEWGYESFTSNKTVVTPFVDFSISRHWSFLLQPSLKYSKVNSSFNQGNQSFYNVISNQIDSSTLVLIDTLSGRVLSTTYNYYYKQVYDSITVRHTVGHSYLEFELPLLAELKFGSFALYGGPVLSLTDIVQIQEQKTSQQLTVNDSAVNLNYQLESVDLNTHFFHRVPAYSETAVIGFQNSATSVLRVGYMLGGSVKIRERLLIDLLMTRSPALDKSITNSDIRKLYTQSFFRLSIGYIIR